MTEDIRILVVEDSPTQAIQLEYTLSSHGYDTTVARDGEDALRAVAEQVPALVITDIVMPRMDGYELCRRLKAEDATREVPVVLLTSLSDPTEVLRAIQAGANYFLTKPWEESFLVERIRQVLHNRAIRDRAAGGALPVAIGGEQVELTADTRQVVDLLLSTYEDAVFKQKELQRLNRELTHSVEVNKSLQKSYSQALLNAADGIVIAGADGTVLFLNQEARTLFGRGDDMLGTALPFTLKPGTVTEVQIAREDGTVVAEVRVSSTYWEGRRASLASMRDVTDKVQQRDALQNLAERDELTGLYNRRGFVTRSEQELHAATTTGAPYVLFFCDMDGMKWINDNLGHQEGDRSLVDIADVLRHTFRRSDIIGRLGGDEFAVLASLDMTQADILKGRLQEHIAAHNSTAGRPFTLAMSVGTMASDPGAPLPMEQLIVRADELMYEEKRRKRATRADLSKP